MGQVWRATDTKLNRDVAIKVIPDTFAQDQDRMARFAREAQVLASLNHPNIAAIHGVEERAIVMDLVESRVKELKSAIAEQVVQLAVSDRNQRLAMLQEIVDARRTIIKERAAHPDNQTTPGGKTGRMVKTLKMIGGGEAAIPVEEWQVDNATDRKVREALKQAAIECGDWAEKKEPPHEGTTATVEAGRPDLRALGPERLQVLIQVRDAEK